MELIVDNYKLESKLLGKGRTSKVFQGINLVTNKKIVMKRMSDKNEAKHEVNILKSCPKHPNIIEFQDYIVTEDYAYIVLSGHPGERLGYYKYGDVRPPDVVIQVIYSILKGLKAIHDAGILHCDLSPHNVLMHLNDPLTIQLIDFGSAVKKDENGEYNGKHKGGTRGYSPPELIRHGTAHLTNASDLFSIGCLCLYLLNGEVPGEIDSACEKISPPLRKILEKATHTNPLARFQNADEMLEELRSL